MTYAALTCRGLIGMVFAVAVLAKVRGPGAYREFASWLAALPPCLARPGRRAAVNRNPARRV